MSILKLIEKLSRLNIAFSIEDDELLIEASEGIVSKEMLEDIRKNKQEIISLLNKKKSPLSFAQERLWYIDQYEHNASYNIPSAVKLLGKLDINVLEKTFLEIIKRHEVLRTNIVTINNVTSQLIHIESKFELKIVDQSHLPEEAANKKNQELIEIESQKPFDLANDSLIRLILYKINDEEHTLFLNKHHIISDGWSFSVFLKEISILYKAFSENKPSPLPELEIQYADYAVWQREHIKGEILIKQSEYWKNKLSGTAILELPTDKTRPNEQTFNGARLPFTIGKTILEKLNVLSKENDATLFMTLLSAFNVLLNKYTGQDDICVGTPIANRTRSEIEPLIGFFVNTFALRSDLAGDISFVDLVKQVRQTTLDAYDNQDIPFEKVVDIVQPERNLSYSPLFQVMMVMQNAPAGELSFGELSLKPVEFESTISKFDLVLSFTETAKGLIGVLEYNTDLFDKDRIVRMIGHLNVLIESIISNPAASISDLEILTSDEKHKLLVEWNDTEVNYPKDKCIHQLFEEQVEKTPENIAVIFGNNQLTYKELNEKSNQLAHLLQTKGAKPNALVGICVERSLEMIIGLLGILKAGGAYVPIDPTYPEERISYILKDADCEIVLSQEHLELPKTNSEIIYLDANWDLIENGSAININSEVKNDDLAYVIYTSGSTGNPKGVMNQHNGIVNRLFWTQDNFKLQDGDVILQKTTYSFDVSVWELFWPIVVGCRLVFAKPEGHKDNQYLIETIIKEKISTIHFVPSMLNTFIDTEGVENCLSLKRVLCSGEVLSYKLTEQFYKKMDNCSLHNLYGPTEAAVDVSYFPCDQYSKYLSIPIGKPVSNTELFILDKNSKLVPIGVPGELHIGGEQVARGYLKRPELTSEQFVKNLFSEDPDSRLYMTGDLARYLPDGNIEFLGRIDNQVKVRGFRIELGEIEATLNKIETIKDCVVVAKEDSNDNKRLVAYIVSDDEINVQELRERLSISLPDYMIPSLFVSLEKMPLTPNGKIDRKSLPESEGNIETTNEYVAPRTTTEQKLADIWTKVLGIEKVGVYDNFFEVGGDSIISIQIVSRANQQGLFVSPKDVFKNQTIASLAKVCGTRKPETIAEQGLIKGKIDLTPIQTWFFENDLVNKDHFNQAVCLQIKESLGMQMLENALNSLVEQHDVLRLAYKADKGSRVQEHHTISRHIIEVKDFADKSGKGLSKAIDNYATKTQASLSITKGVLFKSVLFKTAPGHDNHLLLVIHHLVVDGVSWRILIEDIKKACEQQLGGKSINLGQKTSSFKQWSERLNAYAASGELAKELPFWAAIAEKPAMYLPVDKSAGENTTISTTTVSVSLTKELTKSLLQEAGKAYRTEINDLLLSALAISLSNWIKEKDVTISLEGHGREDLFEDTDISKTIGWFTSLFPVCLSLKGTSGVGDIIKSVKEQLRAIPNKGIGYGLLRYLSEDDTIRNSLKLKGEPGVCFNYLGRFNELEKTDEQAIISMSGESSGQSVCPSNHRSYVIDINSLISGDQLVLNWSYSENLHDRETIEGLAENYVVELQNIIEHCLLPESRAYTPSDFPLTKTSEFI